MWQESPEGLFQSFSFDNFYAAASFTGRVVFLSEAFELHADLKNVGNTIEILLHTLNNAGRAITDGEWMLAEAINNLLN